MDKYAAFKLLYNNYSRCNSVIESVFSAYCYDILREYEKSEEIYEKLFKSVNVEKSNVFELGLLLFGIAEHVRMDKNKKIMNNNINLIENVINKILLLWNKNNPNAFDNFEDRINTSTIGSVYGGLFTINNYLNFEKVNKVIKDLREYVFKNNISKGTLVSSNKSNDVNIDVLFAVVPFGMFSPEDLIVVEAVKEIEDSLNTLSGVKRYENLSYPDTLSTLLLSWYYTEKGDYDKAKKLLKKSVELGIVKTLDLSIYLIVNNILEQTGQVGENIIIHRPYGNYNRYEPGNDERFPKEPCENEKVIIKALTWPISKNMKVYLKYYVNDNLIEDIPGQLKTEGSTNHWYWEIGPFNRYDEVKYFIYIEDETKYSSEVFTFNVLAKNYLIDVNDITVKNGCIYIETNETRLSRLVLLPKKEGVLEINVGQSEHCHNEEIQLSAHQKGSKVKVYWENYLIEINKKPFSVCIFDGNKKVLESISEGWISWYEDKDGQIYRIKCTFTTDEYEEYFGFGERYNSITQKGNLLDVYVYNQYKDQEIRTYLPVPFFISSKEYGIYIDSNYYISFDMAKSNKEFYSFTIENSKFKFNIFIGKPKDIIKKYTDIVGKPTMLPKWAFGPWMSSNNWDSDKEVRKQVELTKHYEIPATVIVIEAWSDEATYYIFNDAIYRVKDGSKGFKYEDFVFPQWGRWPDPKGLVEYLHDNNLKCILWQIPIMKHINGLHHLQKDSDEEYMIKSKYCVLNEDGTPYRIPEGWFSNSLIMDFSNEEAIKWWFEKRRYLVKDIKVDGFKTDGGEFVFGDNLKFSNGKTGREMRNCYPNDYVKSYYEFINETNPNGGITFSRAGFTGAQKYPAHWAGDEKSTFKAFRNSIIAGLTAGISGISFWGWDIAGFSGDIPSSELFIRSTQMAVFCPIMQYHAESKAEFNQDRTPWNIAERTGDKKVLDYYRKYANLRMNLIPYIYSQAMESSLTGLPLMRALFIEYPNDRKCLEIQDQYLFGDILLVAPVVYEEMDERAVYFPEGEWIGLWNKKIYQGKGTFNIKAPLDKIPIFIKNNSVLPLNLNDKFELAGKISSEVDRYENLTFRIYGRRIKDYHFFDENNNYVKLNIFVEKGTNINIEGNIESICLMIDVNDNNITVDSRDYKVIEKYSTVDNELILRLKH